MAEKEIVRVFSGHLTILLLQIGWTWPLGEKRRIITGGKTHHLKHAE